MQKHQTAVTIDCRKTNPSERKLIASLLPPKTVLPLPMSKHRLNNSVLFYHNQ